MLIPASRQHLEWVHQPRTIGVNLFRVIGLGYEIKSTSLTAELFGPPHRCFVHDSIALYRPPLRGQGGNLGSSPLSGHSQATKDLRCARQIRPS